MVILGNMLVPPKYTLTPKISQLLSSIEASKQIIDSVAIPLEVETNIRRQSTLRSSLFSARIEGNNLTLDDLSSASKNQKNVEVFNILRALNVLNKNRRKDLRSTDILNYHQIALDGLTVELGRFRKEANAIFNSAGIAVYLPPRPALVPNLIKKLVSYVNSSKEQFIPIKACITHYTFEKIHPFLDGNGRVGRILLQKVLHQGGYGMKGLLSTEEFLDSNRTEYYQVLNEPERDVTSYLEFMLEAIEKTAREAKELVLQKKKLEATDYLLPRRAEIYNIIKDHKLVNFDMLRRRFMAVNERTLRYDLKKLQDARLIRKRGATNGAYYEAVIDK